MINLVARTLAGSEYKVQVGAKATVRELKHKLCEQAKGFSVDEMRLLKGPVTLADDSKTLAECGIKDGGTVHIVRSLQASDGNDDGVAGAEIKSPSANVVTVTVPPGNGPGSRLLINPPNRRQMMVVVPAGVRAGSNFRVQLPPLPTTSTTPATSGTPTSTTAPSSSSSSSSASRGQVMQVKCPPGTVPGQQILIMVPGRGRMRVQVPSGVTPGSTFRFQLPA